MTTKIGGAAMLYQKQEGNRITNKVRGCLITVDEGDDEFSLKAKAERYIANHESMSPETKDLNLVGWWFSWEEKEETLSQILREITEKQEHISACIDISEPEKRRIIEGLDHAVSIVRQHV